MCEKVAKKDSISVKQAIIHMLKDSRAKTITPDRGKEFSQHEEISKALNDVQFYFPEPHPVKAMGMAAGMGHTSAYDRTRLGAMLWAEGAFKDD